MDRTSLRILRYFTRQFILIAPSASLILVIMGYMAWDHFRKTIQGLHLVITLSAVGRMGKGIPPAAAATVTG